MRQGNRGGVFASIALAFIVLTGGAAHAHSGFTMAAAQLTTAAPVLDGVMSPGEWGSASTFVFPAGEAAGRVWAMHDGNYVYVAFRKIDATPGTTANFQVYFDSDHNGALNAGDDAWSVGVDPATGSSGTNDAHYRGETCPSCWPDDVGHSGTNDTQGAATYTPASGEAVFEMRHPRCSADTGRDICLPADGSLVGATFLYFSATSSVFYPASFGNPAGYGDFSLVPVSGGGPPDTTLTASPPDYADVATASFAFTSSAAGASFECSLDGGAFEACTSPKAYTGLSDGPHRFRVRAVSGGEADQTPASWRWTVDTVPFPAPLDQSNGRVLSTAGGRSIGGANANEIAQIITAGETARLVEARVGLSCPAPSTVQARIEGTTGGGPNGTVLASATVSDAGPGTAFKRFAFTPAPTVNPGTNYALVLAGPTTPGCFTYAAEDAYFGNVYFRGNDTSGWQPNVAPEDVAFATFKAAATASLVVTNQNDGGAGSLRQAIVDANATPAHDTITFNIPGGGTRIIAPATALPTITAPVTIDARTQPGYAAGSPAIQLMGPGPPNTFVGLNIAANGVSVYGVFMNRFSNGITITGNENRIAASHVRDNGNIGIIVSGTSNTVGGTAAADVNVVSGNGGNGIVVGTASGTTIRGNLIGVDGAGAAAAPNAINGILVNPGADGTRIVDNVISGNGNDGVFVHTQATVRGNRIGVAAGSDTAIPNSGDGVQLNGSGSVVGGEDPPDANVIARNTLHGVFVSAGSGNRITKNSIHSNGQLGIALNAGVNNGQQAPEVQDVALGDGAFVQGRIVSTPGTAFVIEIFRSRECDPSGSGEGEQLVGTTNVTTTPAGDASFAVRISGTFAAGDVFTATATDPNGNTSAFSACRRATSAGDARALTSPADCTPRYLGGHTITFDDAAAGPVGERYRELGVGFGATSPAIHARGDTTSSPPNSLRNGSGALTLTFQEPQTRVGFFAGNGRDGVVARVSAFDGDDNLGAVLVPLPTANVTTYAGFRSDDVPFRRVVIEYVGGGGPVELDDLCFLTHDAAGEENAAVTLTTDQSTVPAGAKLVPLSAVPSNQLPSFAGSPSSAPVGSVPVGSVPVGSVPVGSVPVGSVPVGSVPVGSVPVGSVPVGSVPVGSVGLTGVPVGSVGLDQILLSMLPIDADALLAGTPLANQPRQSVTLREVYANATTRDRFENLTLAQSGLLQSVLSGVPYIAFLLGDATLAQLPPPGSATWCGAITAAGGSCAGVSGTNTVLGLAIAGVPVGSVPVGSVPVGSVPVGSVPVGSVPVGSVDLEASRLADIPVGSVPNPDNVFTCGASCDSSWKLRDAKAAGAIKDSARLRHLVGAFPSDLVLNDILMGIIPRSALAWESLPIDGFQLFAGTGDSVRYRLAFELTCPVASTFAARVRLPVGWLYKVGTTRWRYDGGTAQTGAEPTTTARAGARWTSMPGTPCPSGATRRDVELSFEALSGFALGPHPASAAVTLGDTTHSTGENVAPVLVTQNWEANDDPATAPEIQANRLVIGHVASAGDKEIFRVPIPTVRGTRTLVYLSHIAEGADFDLVITKPEAPPIQSAPVGSVPVGSVPIEDGGSSLNNAGDALPPETLQDIPVGSVPVGSVSANRGNEDEAAQVAADGEQGFYTITVTGYNGSHSPQPFVLRVVQTPPPALPPCPDRNLTLGPAGTLPAPQAGTQTLFIVNKQRLAAMYGAAATDQMLAAAAAVASRGEVAGQILEVDGSADVRAAYAAWDASPCSIGAANNVVRAINDVVAGYRAALPGIKYVVLLGTDEALPMMRRFDPVTISNEMDAAQDVFFTTVTPNGQRANALFAAAALGYYLSDSVYGAFTSIPWLGRDLYLPNAAVGRLVETPVEIRRQLELYVSAAGVLNPQSTLTTAYDFLTDGGQGVASGLAGIQGATNELLINDTWNALTLKNVFTDRTPPHDVLSVNAHYSHWLLQPAAGNALVSTGDLPALPSNSGVEPAFARRVLFTMGCHGGWNVPDTLIGGTPTAYEAQRLLDWTQAYARQRSAVYVANTGFGYGDTVANALSERLMSIFAGKLAQGGKIGDRWVDSVHEYFGTAGVYGVYDEKALTEATFYGLPFWSLGGGPGAASSASVPAPAPGPIAGVSVSPVTVTPSLHEQSTPRGRFWGAGPRRDTLAVHYRPIQPRIAVDVTHPGLVATGAMITGLQTQDVGGVDPVNATPTIDLAANEPERKFRELIFPANLVALNRSRGTRGARQHAVVIAGQFRPGSSPGAGTERLVQSIGLEIAYVSSPSDTTPPLLEEVDALQAGGSATILVRASETAAGGVRRVAAIYSDGAGGGVLTWNFTELTFDANLGRWTATVPAAAPIQVVAMAQNANGLVGYSANKGVNFPSVTDQQGPSVLLESPAPEAVYTLNQRVPLAFTCSDAGVVQSCTADQAGPNLDTSRVGRHTLTITATDLSGNRTERRVPYSVRYRFQGFFEPIENPPTINVGTAGRTYPIKWRLTDASGAYVRALSAVQSISRIPLTGCGSRPQEEAGAAEDVPASALRYDSAQEQYVYTWRTDRDPGCWRLVIELADGTRRSADFLLRS